MTIGPLRGFLLLAGLPTIVPGLIVASKVGRNIPVVVSPAAPATQRVEDHIGIVGDIRGNFRIRWIDRVFDNRGIRGNIATCVFSHRVDGMDCIWIQAKTSNDHRIDFGVDVVAEIRVDFNDRVNGVQEVEFDRGQILRGVLVCRQLKCSAPRKINTVCENRLFTWSYISGRIVWNFIPRIDIQLTSSDSRQQRPLFQSRIHLKTPPHATPLRKTGLNERNPNRSKGHGGCPKGRHKIVTIYTYNRFVGN